MSFTDSVQRQFQTLLDSAAGVDEKAFRQAAWSQFGRLGLPGRATETWKYSSLNNVTRNAWDLSPRTGEIPAAALALAEKWKDKFDVLILVNGELRTPAPAGVKALAFAGDELEFEDGWIGLSVALARPGLDLNITDILHRPLLLIHAQAGGRGWSPTFHRVTVGEKASAVLAELFVGEGEYLRSEITVANVKKDGALNWLRVQMDSTTSKHFSDVQSHVAEGARLNLTQINEGAEWSRSALRADIHGRGGRTPRRAVLPFAQKFSAPAISEFEFRAPGPGHTRLRPNLFKGPS